MTAPRRHSSDIRRDVEHLKHMGAEAARYQAVTASFHDHLLYRLACDVEPLLDLIAGAEAKLISILLGEIELDPVPDEDTV